MLKVIVIGAAGRMGKRLVANIVGAEDMELAGAVEFAECPLLGADAGTVAGIDAQGVGITAELQPLLENADAIIDFSTGTVVDNARVAVAADCSVVIGTTALNDDEKAELKKLSDSGGRIVFAPNMSVGVNLLFDIAGKVAKILGEDYDIEVVEMHHNQKKDSPSGTAARLGEVLLEARNMTSENLAHGREGMVGVRPKKEIGMHALRGGDVVGEHTVIFATGGERVELTHKASSRDTFAKGAVRAVRFLATAKPGLYDMQDVLGLK